MSNIKKSTTELIGHTPLLELTHYEKDLGLKARLVAKVEYFNLTGSVKDRIAYQMIVDAEEAGLLKPGATITAKIFYKESKNVTKLPYSSVINENGKYYVFVVGKGNKVSKKEVKVGLNDDSYYEIASGVSIGEKVITVADETLKDGQKIKIADPSKQKMKPKGVIFKEEKPSKRGGGPGGPPR